MEKQECILYFLPKTLKCLLTHLPSQQEKVDGVMKGEMIMSSPVNGIQPTRTMPLKHFQGILDGASDRPSPCPYKRLQWGIPLDGGK